MVLKKDVPLYCQDYPQHAFFGNPVSDHACCCETLVVFPDAKLFLKRHWYWRGRLSWLEHQTQNGTVVSLIPGRIIRRISLSRVDWLRWLLFGVHSTPASLPWHIKDPSHCAKSAGGKLHLNIHTPLTQHRVCWLCCPGIVGEPTWESNSQAVHQGTLGHNHLGCLSPPRKRKKKENSTSGEWMVEPSPEKVPGCEEKATTTTWYAAHTCNGQNCEPRRRGGGSDTLCSTVTTRVVLQ